MSDWSQESLLTDPTPGRVRRSNPSTSKRAARNISVKSGALKHRILRHLAAQGANGANDWELHVACDPGGRVHSAATRRGELEDLGMVRRTSITRPTDDLANEGLVHIITEKGLAALAEVEARSAA